MSTILRLFILLQLTITNFATATTITYTESNDDIVNPDRGFYNAFDGVASNFYPLSLSTLQDLRNTLQTPNWDASYQVKSSIVFRHYILDSYVGTDVIPQAFLDKIQTDFDTARTAGVRLILRFSYTITPNTGNCGSWICPPYGDAPKSRVMAHIAQLAPYLQNNEDVIFSIQNGFIGVWGEQYYTDYFGDASTQNGRLTDGNWYDRSDVVFSLLQAVPTSRKIQLRTPQMKQKYYAPSAPITTPAMSVSQAHDGSDASRLGFHNDCFLTDESDQGTYGDLGSTSVAPQYGTSAINTIKNYHIADSQYTVVGGETCADVDPVTMIDHPNDCSDGVVNTMDDFNYSYLNGDYNNQVNNDWEGVCMDTIKKRLGYRFVLESGTYPDNVNANDTANFSFTVKNVGFAAPANERNLNLVLRNTSNNNEYKLPITGANSDTRLWFSGQTVTLNPSITIPAYIESGSYDIFLQINDLSNNGAIQDRPEYSIQLANTNIWEASSGYNDLNHTITINGSSTPVHNIVIDGYVSDWDNISYSVLESGQQALGIKTHFDANWLYLGFTGGNMGNGYQVFIDADNNASTGYGSNGADYLIENGSLLPFNGTNGSYSWSWNIGAAVSIIDNNINTDQLRELKIDRTLFNATPLSSTINLFYVDLLNWAVQSQLPSSGAYMPMSTN